MKMAMDTRKKIMSAAGAAELCRASRAAGDAVVFTNGCFDLMHAGHVRYLNQARALGGMLVVGLNSDDSVRRLDKGPGRPVTPQDQRAEVLAGLASVDAVVIFNEDTPARLIEIIAPDVLVKGGDWPVEKMVGAREVMARGGRALSLPLVPGISTTAAIERIRGGGA